ncbi:MAG: discoidin domain-containing protein, partial [Planctomycetia bacterium]|nr:discoidin domain-containing protein [Planctomycetia bacterium]
MRIHSLMLTLASAAVLCAPVSAELITAERVLTLQTHGGTSIDNNYKNNNASDGNVDSLWCTLNPNGGNNYYLNGSVNPVMVFDLGTNQTLDALSVWGYPYSGNSLQKFTLSFYDGSQGFDGTPIAVQNVTMEEWTQNATNIALTAPVTAQYVKMEV